MSDHPQIAIIGAGPAGLIAAEHLAEAGFAVEIFDRMPTPGRKFLMAGRGGLNLTHSEPLEAFPPRYREAAQWLQPLLADFGPDALRAWAEGLGQATFIGSSGRVFPKAMKASPLLRAWRARLEEAGIVFSLRARWTGWDGDGALRFETPAGDRAVKAGAVILALGGASWPRLGSDAGWTALLQEKGVEIAPFQPSNCGVEIAWSPVVRDRFAGQALKTIALSCGDESVRGEALISAYGLEGGAVYALSAPIRHALAREGAAELVLDLKPDLNRDQLAARLVKARKGESLANRLRKAGLSRPAAGLLREGGLLDPGAEALADRIKALRLNVTAQRGLERAISAAGGVKREAVDETLMLTRLPGVFIAGEMLDWEAPTGGYLLQACFATGVRAARGAQAWLAR